jgi:chloride channel protein, CIC family
VQLSMTGANAVQYLPLQGLNHQATMAEVFAILEDKREGAVYIYREEQQQLIGIIRWDQVRSLLVKQNNLL